MWARRPGAVFIDGVTKKAYEANLEEDSKALYMRLKSGEYRATPVLRVYIEKPDGGKRPLAIPALEDKTVQGAVVEILNCICECDFVGFSYGFRPKRSAHQALQALQTVLQKGEVNWVAPTTLGEMFRWEPFLIASHGAELGLGICRSKHVF